MKIIRKNKIKRIFNFGIQEYEDIWLHTSKRYNVVSVTFKIPVNNCCNTSNTIKKLNIIDKMRKIFK